MPKTPALPLISPPFARICMAAASSTSSHHSPARSRLSESRTSSKGSTFVAASSTDGTAYGKAKRLSTSFLDSSVKVAEALGKAEEPLESLEPIA